MKKLISLEYVIFGIIMTVYMTNCFIHNNVVGNLTAPLVSFISVHLLYKTYRKVQHYKAIWMTALIGCLSWGISDSIWAYYDLVLGIDPNGIALFLYSYMIINFCILIALVQFFIARFRKWNYVQLILDIGAIISVGLILIWIFFFDGRSKTFLTMNMGDIVNFIYTLTDFISVCIIIVVYGSVKTKKTPLTLKFLVVAIVLYCFTDVYYVYLDYNESYVQNSLVDGFYILSMFIFGLSAIVEYHYPNINAVLHKRAELPENIGRRYRFRFLFIIPALMMVFDTNGMLIESLLFVLILSLHYFMSSYVQLAIKNEYLLAMEMTHNEQLEDKIAERTKALEKLTNLDVLTGLYNRRYFMNKVDELIDHGNSQTKLTIFYMDLDMFKAINDSHGHDMGDAVIMEVGRKLNRRVPENATLARLGGDEFVIALQGDYTEERILEIANSIISLLQEPIIINPYFFNISASIGIASYPTDATERNKLMKYADIAMYHAKANAHNSIELYRPFLSDQVERRHEIELLLRRVNFDEEFELYYQPQFSIPEVKLVGVEALLRWKNPIKGFISPAEFIPIAEDTGIIVGIGDWVLSKATKQISYWNTKYASNIRMGINISPKQTDSLSFISNLERLFRELNINPAWIDIEITERIAMKGEIAMEETFNSLRNMGVLVSIDDFGTGYSSLSYIKMFDIDRIKIAKELIDNITKDDGSMQIVRAIIMMTKAMGLVTIAEGVEYNDQLVKLIELGCDEIQGYIFSKPVPCVEFEDKFMKLMY